MLKIVEAIKTAGRDHWERVARELLAKGGALCNWLLRNGYATKKKF
jgi:hypothetical protein